MLDGIQKANVTIEAIPSGKSLPDWLFEALASNQSPELIIIYPNERSRKSALNNLASATSYIDSSKHTTMQRLFDTLHLDFRLPSKIQDDALLFSIVHQRTQQHAHNGQLPLMFSPVEGRIWSEYKTERLQSLHRELSELKRPWKWENDPGVKEFNNILKKIEQQMNCTYPDLMKSNLLERLNLANQEKEVPFSLSGVEGIIILDHAPDFSEVNRLLLQSISRITPIHQLCNPGSFRLGFHGAFVEDVEWCDEKTIPKWVPKHEVWRYPKQVNWTSPVGKLRNTQIHRISLERKHHNIDTTFQLIKNYLSSNDGSIIVIDAGLKHNTRSWKSRLNEMGIISNFKANTLLEQPSIAGLITLLQIGEGLEAWSFEKFRRLIENNGLPIEFTSFNELIHTTEKDWKPKPHLDILEKISRNFHVLGGPGALGRWIKTLENAKPIIGDDVELVRQKLEETQWWLANICRFWSPLYDEAKDFCSESFLGCSTGSKLPLIEELSDGNNWINEIYKSINWKSLMNLDAEYSNSITGLQKLIEEHHRLMFSLDEIGLKYPNSGEDFIRHLMKIIHKTKLQNSRLESANVKVLTPLEAFGMEADLIILSGLDVDSWSMKAPKIPWLDSESRLELGLLNSDLEIRIARHHLKHFLNAAETVVILDTSEDESIGPAAPLVEFLEESKHSEQYQQLSIIPSFIAEHEYDESNPDRSWDLKSQAEKEPNIWLTPRPYSMSMGDDGAIGHRSGFRGRDFRQRTGLNLASGREIYTLPISVNNLASAHEFSIYNDRLSRQPSHKNINKDEYLPWDSRELMVSVEDLTMQPTKSQASIGSKDAKEWPHLGMKGSRSKGPAIDPRPLPMFESGSESIQSITGLISQPIIRKKWSASRIQSWLKCPRQAWLEKHLGARELEQPTEDIDDRVRGVLVHEIEGAILEGHGIEVSGEPSKIALPLSKGPLDTIDKVWKVALNYLELNAEWLTRSNAVAHHRCRDMIGFTPEEWNLYLQGEKELPPRGRIGRLLEADFTLEHSAPIACEWVLSTGANNGISLQAKSDNDSLVSIELTGRIDRVDCIVLTKEMREKAILDGILSEDESKQQRWIIIRDMKNINGPKKADRGDRHRRAIFDEVQLGLYAKAWETAYPNDRVVGVGISEIGETTTHYVEIDSSVKKYIHDLSIGEITDYTSIHHRPLSDKEFISSNGFRSWMDERLRTSARVIEHSKSGIAQPVPGKHCSYCSSRRMCPSALLGGDEN